jgi:hypothetical protein
MTWLFTARSCSHEFAWLVAGPDLPHGSFHGLGLGHASMLIEAGENLKAIRERLGTARRASPSAPAVILQRRPDRARPIALMMLSGLL